MQFTGKLTELDLRDVQKTARTRMYWPKLLLRNLYGTLLLLAVVWVTISGLLGYIKPNWKALGIVWVVVATIIVWAVFSSKKAQTKGLSKLNEVLPDDISLANDGVKMNGPNGATGFLPWRNFKGWREGQRVVFIDKTEENSSVLLPVAQCSEIEREQLRQLLRSQIPPVH